MIRIDKNKWELFKHTHETFHFVYLPAVDGYRKESYLCGCMWVDCETKRIVFKRTGSDIDVELPILYKMIKEGIVINEFERR